MRERQQLTDEKRAFERFIKRVERIETTRPQAVASGPVIDVRSTPGLDNVRDAYAETVMSTPHYSDLYDETVSESIAEELGEELAAAIEHRSRFDPQLKRSIREMTSEAIFSRDRLLSELDSEIESIERSERALSDARTELKALGDQPVRQLEFNALRLTRERLSSLREDCDDLAAKRQAEIRKRRRLTLADVGSFEQYLYDDCEFSYPILSAIAEIGSVLNRTRSRIDRRLVTIG